jgi:hypothetical protein
MRAGTPYEGEPAQLALATIEQVGVLLERNGTLYRQPLVVGKRPLRALFSHGYDRSNTASKRRRQHVSTSKRTHATGVDEVFLSVDLDHLHRSNSSHEPGERGAGDCLVARLWRDDVMMR